MAAGNLLMLNVTNSTAALFLFMLSSVVSVSVLKGKISESLNL